MNGVDRNGEYRFQREVPALQSTTTIEISKVVTLKYANKKNGSALVFFPVMSSGDQAVWVGL